jgi:C-terminal processing protease CtpA/Prc
MKLYRVIAIFAALLASASGASAQQQTVATGHKAKADVGFGVEIQLARGSGGMRRTGYPRVSSVTPGSSAARAGLAVGDVLVAVDGRDTQQAGAWFAEAVPGRRYTLRVRRGQAEQDLVIEAGPPPAGD